MITARVPAAARPRCAIALSRRLPPNVTVTSWAKLPNTANRAICASPMTLNVSAKISGMTIVARTARIAAGTDHDTRHHGLACGPGGRSGAPALWALADGAIAL